jgi:hypothetical protein
VNCDSRDATTFLKVFDLILFYFFPAVDSSLETQVENLVLNLGAKEHREAIEGSARKKMSMKDAMSYVRTKNTSILLNCI